MNKKNMGISLLKIILSFLVVLCHFYDGGKIKSLAVPLFVVLSFYLIAKNILKSYNIKKRIQRLFIPYVFWAIIYFVFFSVMSGKVMIKELAWQLALGSSPYLNPPLWYLADVMIIVIIMFAIYKYTDNIRMANSICIVSSVFCLIMQYTGINYMLFASLRYEVRYPLGRIMEVFPYASVGVMLYQMPLEKIFQKYRNLFALIVGCGFTIYTYIHTYIHTYTLGLWISRFSYADNDYFFSCPIYCFPIKTD